jgi:acyl-coenzyme A thioesterase PaaI-like protein
MAETAVSPGAELLGLWQRLRRLPGGRLLFSVLLGRRIPYTGTIRPRVEELRAGYAEVTLPDHKRVRNHLASIHAVAITNLGELAGGIATLTGIPPGVRGIVLRLESQYLKKARGTLRAVAEWTPPEEWVRGEAPLQGEETIDCWVQASVQDEAGDEVARVRALWRLGRVR